MRSLSEATLTEDSAMWHTPYLHSLSLINNSVLIRASYIVCVRWIINLTF